MRRSITAAARAVHDKRQTVEVDEQRLQALQKAAGKLARPASSSSSEELTAMTERARAQLRRG
jgi:hypothetical protein